MFGSASFSAHSGLAVIFLHWQETLKEIFDITLAFCTGFNEYLYVTIHKFVITRQYDSSKRVNNANLSSFGGKLLLKIVTI